VLRSKVHIALNVRDLRESTEFYRAMLAAEPAKIRPTYVKFDVSEPPLNLALNETAVDETSAQGCGALSHFGIEVSSTNEVLAMRQRLENAGLTAREEMQISCCYALQDKVWTRDPDGNEWEVFVVLGEAADTRELRNVHSERRTRQEAFGAARNLAKQDAALTRPTNNEPCCAAARAPPTKPQDFASDELAEAPSLGVACCSPR
jgi:catechol 2,3-dioxygenase-like lactoylglutathione lyase family enzyme